MIWNQNRVYAYAFFGGIFVASIAAPQTTPLPAPTDPASVMDGPCWRQLKQDGDSEKAWACVEMSLSDADEELNRIYQEKIGSVDPGWAHADDHIEALKQAQRAWIAFRDADCTRIGVAARGDANLWIQTCYEYQTRKRIEELQSLNPAPRIRFWK